MSKKKQAAVLKIHLDEVDIEMLSFLKDKYGATKSKVIRKLIRKEFKNQIKEEQKKMDDEMDDLGIDDFKINLSKDSQALKFLDLIELSPLAKEAKKLL